MAGHEPDGLASTESQNYFTGMRNMNLTVNQGERMEVGSTRSEQLSIAVVDVGMFSSGLRDFSQVLFYSAADEPPTRKDASKSLL